MASPPGKLYLIPNLLDPQSQPESVLPVLVLERLRSLRRYIVEGEKAAWRLLSRVLGQEEAAEVTMERLDEHTKIEDLPHLLDPLLAGENVGLLSEAGMPCVADPGAALVALAHEKGIEVSPLPGPSSILLALAASGLEGQRFSFLGYLPQERADRKETLTAIDQALRVDGATRIFIETPYRNDKLLEDCLSSLSESTRLCVAVSLSGPSERIRSASISAWRRSPWRIGKEPAIFLVGAPAGGTGIRSPQNFGFPRIPSRRGRR